MNIESIPSMIIHNDIKNSPAGSVIKLEEIKSILYLGLKGNVNLKKIETHTIDTFA